MASIASIVAKAPAALVDLATNLAKGKAASNDQNGSGQVQAGVEAKNIARYGFATPNNPSSAVTANPNLPAGFGSTNTGQIFRYDAKGNVGTTPSPTTSPAPATQAAASASGAASGSGTGFGVSAPSVLTKEQYLAKFGPGTVDEDAIREAARRRLQASIDATNGAYDAMMLQQDRVNRGAMGSTRAMAARDGTLTSDMGAADLQNQENANAQANSAIMAKRAAEIARLNMQADELAQTDIADARTRNEKEADSYNAYREAQGQKALDYARSAAVSGLTMADLKAKDPTGFAKMLADSGQDEVTFNAAMELGKLALAKEKAAATGDKDGVNKTRDDARATVKMLWDQFGSEAFKKLPADERRRYEKLAELPEGTLDIASETLGERKVGVTEDAQDLKEKTADKNRYKSIPATKYHGTLTLDTQTGIYVDQNGKAVPDSVVKAGGAVPSGTGGSASVKTPGKAPMTFDQFVAGKEAAAGMSLTQAKRDALKPEYDAYLKTANEAAKPQVLTSKDYTATERRNLQRIGIMNDAAAKEFLAQPAAFRTWYQTYVSAPSGPVTPQFIQDQKKKWVAEIEAKKKKMTTEEKLQAILGPKQ